VQVGVSMNTHSALRDSVLGITDFPPSRPLGFSASPKRFSLQSHLVNPNDHANSCRATKRSSVSVPQLPELSNIESAYEVGTA
jgi:hypothetical protein